MMEDKLNRQHPLLIHLLAWMVLLGMPLFNARSDRPTVDVYQYVHFILTSASFMIVFYVNYLLLIRRYLSEKKVVAFLLWNILVFIVLFFMVGRTALLLLPPPGTEALSSSDLLPARPSLFKALLGNSCLYFLVVGASVAVKMTGKWYRTEAEKKEAEKNLAEAELEHLKSQINPHFLFNTLNNIYSLIALNPEQARKAVHDLSKSLRYVLYESDKATVSVQQEVEFMEEYIALMRIRLPRTVRFTLELPGHGEEIMSRSMAPMLLIPLIENAFKHGVGSGEDSFITISVRSEDGVLVCETANSDHPKTDSDRSGSGIGLDNLKRRLGLLYAGRHTYTCGVSEGTYRALLKLQL